MTAESQVSRGGVVLFLCFFLLNEDYTDDIILCLFSSLWKVVSLRISQCSWFVFFLMVHNGQNGVLEPHLDILVKT